MINGFWKRFWLLAMLAAILLYVSGVYTGMHIGE